MLSGAGQVSSHYLKVCMAVKLCVSSSDAKRWDFSYWEIKPLFIWTGLPVIFNRDSSLAR